MRHWAVRIILALLEHQLVRMALLKFLGSAAANGIRSWFIKQVVDKLYDALAVPIILLSIRKGKRLYNQKTGEHLYVRLSKVRQNENWDEYKSTLDNIFNG